MRKGFAPIIAIAIIAVLLIGIGAAVGYSKLKNDQLERMLGEGDYNFPDTNTNPAASPVPNETANPDLIGANWKTYTNKKLQFSVKLPTDLPNPRENILSTRTEIEFGTVLVINVGVFYDQEKQRGLNYLEVAQTQGSSKKQPETTTINDYKAAYLKMRQEDMDPPPVASFNFVSIEKGNEIYSIYYEIGNYQTSKENQERKQKDFDQILSTFKFLE